MRNEAIWMENQYFDNLPLDPSRQVGDQFLIYGSPQTRFGRIGEWASDNLQPWESCPEEIKRWTTQTITTSTCVFSVFIFCRNFAEFSNKLSTINSKFLAIYRIVIKTRG